MLDSLWSAVADDLFARTHALLNKTAPRHAADAMCGEIPDDDHSGVMQKARDLIGSFGRVLGPAHFAQYVLYLPEFLPLIVELCQVIAAAQRSFHGGSAV